MVLSVEVFILGPHLRGAVDAAGPAATPLLTVAAAGGATALLAGLSPLAAAAFVCVTLFVVLLCPWWLVRAWVR